MASLHEEQAIVAPVDRAPLVASLTRRRWKRAVSWRAAVSNYGGWVKPIAAGGVFLALWFVVWAGLIISFSGKVAPASSAGWGSSTKGNVTAAQVPPAVNFERADRAIESR